MGFKGAGSKSTVVLSQIITKELKSECICYFKTTFPGMNFQFPAQKTKEHHLGPSPRLLKSMGVWALESILAVYIIWNEMWQTVKLSFLTKHT